MNTMKTALGVLGVWLMAMACPAQPDRFNYQGRLVATNGVPVNGTLTVVSRIYDQAAGGSHLWEQTSNGVAALNGIYSLEIGDDDLGTVLTNSACWLEMTIDGDALAPRQRLVSVPYAIRAKSAETAQTAVNA